MSEQTEVTGQPDDEAQTDAAACGLCGAALVAGSAGPGQPGESGDPVQPAGRPACPVCGWLVGDAPDTDLPRPRVDVVYYLRWNERIKIGTSRRPRERLAAIWHQELLAFERGDRTLERLRHEQFAGLREGGEWFRADVVLLDHIAEVAGDTPPWDAYARWMADALRACVT